jgi:hypothetical protein
VINGARDISTIVKQAETLVECGSQAKERRFSIKWLAHPAHVLKKANIGKMPMSLFGETLLNYS